MKLFTEEIEKQLQDQYKFGAELEQQNVVAKIFNAYGQGTWYLLNQDPNDKDYLWAIVDLFELEMGSVSKTDLETTKVPPFNLPLERDLHFKPVNAKELWDKLRKKSRYDQGGSICEVPLDAGESTNLNKKMDSAKRKNEKIAKWIRTRQIDGVEVITIREAAKKLKMSVNDLLPYIPR